MATVKLRHLYIAYDQQERTYRAFECIYVTTAKAVKDVIPSLYE